MKNLEYLNLREFHEKEQIYREMETERWHRQFRSKMKLEILLDGEGGRNSNRNGEGIGSNRSALFRSYINSNGSNGHHNNSISNGKKIKIIRAYTPSGGNISRLGGKNNMNMNISNNNIAMGSSKHE